MEAGSRKKVKKYIWLSGWLLILIIIILLSSEAENTEIIKLLRDYLVITFVIVSGEVLGRMIHNTAVKKSYVLQFLPELREEQLEEQLIKLQNKTEREKNPSEIIDSVAELTKNSLAMLGVLSSITMTLSVLAISVSNRCGHSVKAGLIIFTASSFLAFTVFIMDLTLCYTLLEPSIKRNPKILISGARKYYYLTMFGLILLGITFAWGVYVFTPLFHPETLQGKLSLCVLLLVLVIFYILVFMY